MTFLKISIPVYEKDKWGHLQRDGKLEVSSDVDNLSDGYQLLKIEIEKLLADINAENCLAMQAHQFHQEIESKAYILKSLVRDIEKATEHYENLKIFLEKLGIDPIASRLTFDKRFLLKDASLSQIDSLSNFEF